VDTGTIIAILAPIVAIQVLLIVLALRDLARPDRTVQGGNKWAWVVVIVLFGLIGPTAYFWVGREPE
jgi:Phospholipase_D-nuclease N-terminal